MVKLAIILLGALLLITGCGHSPSIKPDISKWDMSQLPISDGWALPPKSWVDYFSAGDTVSRVIKIHTPKKFVMSQMVSTVSGDDGVLTLTLNPPMLIDGNHHFEITSEYPKESPKLQSYDPNTHNAVMAGFAPIRLNRLVNFSYVPEYFDVAAYYAPPQGSDSQVELVNKRVIVPAPSEASSWVILSAKNSNSNNNYITARLDPQETLDVTVTVSAPKGVSVPDNWEFRIGISTYTGLTFAQGVMLSSEVNCKFIVSSVELDLR